MNAEIPPYRDLPVLGNGLPHSWDVFKSAIDLGTANFLTPEVVAHATRTEVRSGERINVTLPLTLPNPPFFGRAAYRHTIHEPVPNVLDDVLDNFYPQSSSQWDALRHRRDPDAGFFGGLSREDAGPGGSRLGVDAWAQQGLIGRGVLVDVATHLERRGDYDPTTGVSIGADVLVETLETQGTERLPGDVLLVRTGYMDRYLAASDDGRRAIRDGGASAGLSPGAETAAYLWDSRCSAVAVDNPGVEVLPRNPDEPYLHARLIPMLGFPMGEFFAFDQLVRTCEHDDRYSCLFVSVPLNLPGGVGSPANAIVIR
ncbi:cyclase family protein [Streptomyces sp. NPDC051572]|uniref:cyclase family protein n=1 Tax=unclassified Streptomyces TaxID=2593676 RepID=UPI00344E89AF